MIPPIVATVRKAARQHGWAVGVHGSMVRDIDLIVIPWAEPHSDPNTVIDAIRAATGYELLGGRGLGPNRPGGRRSVLLTHQEATFEQTEKGTWTPPALDISFMPDSRPMEDP